MKTSKKKKIKRIKQKLVKVLKKYFESTLMKDVHPKYWNKHF